MSTNLLDILVTELVGRPRARLDRLASAKAATSLAAWAATAGFAVVDPFDADVIEASEEAFLLCVPDQRREVGTALRRPHARGQLYLVDSFRSDVGGGRAATGIVTSTAAIHLHQLSASVPSGWERHRTRHSIIVHTDGPLDLARAQALAHWLTGAETSLPGMPGAARL
jgi:hypothetical protein